MYASIFSLLAGGISVGWTASNSQYSRRITYVAVAYTGVVRDVSERCDVSRCPAAAAADNRCSQPAAEVVVVHTGDVMSSSPVDQRVGGPRRRPGGGRRRRAATPSNHVDHAACS